MPLLPVHTVQLRPPMEALPVAEPTGWTLPVRLNQIITSVWLTPFVFGVESIQMS